MFNGSMLSGNAQNSLRFTRRGEETSHLGGSKRKKMTRYLPMQDSHLRGLVLNKYLKQRRRTKIREEIYFHIDFLTTIIK